jgi:HlyB family type I secretion system ABC transporter
MTPRFEDVLRRTSLVRFVPPEHYARLRDRFTEERFDFGDVIVRQGEEADAFFVLVTGRARVLKESPNADETPLNRLVPGDEFGEGALLTGGPRGATVRASTTVEALRLERPAFLALVAEFPALREALELLARWRTLHGFLYEFSNFGRLPGPALHALMAELKPARATKGETILREGDPPGPMFIVQSGRVRVFTGPRESAVNRAFYREGDFFGELSILNGTPRAATAEAMGDCELLALAPEAVRALRTKFPEFDRLLAERLAQYQRTDEARVPLDFAEEVLPADTQVFDKTTDAEEVDEDSADPFAQDGLFRKRPGRRRFAPVLQVDEMDCGAASLAMVCRSFGRDVNLSRIRALCHTASDGTSLKGICAAATELGLAARALKVSARHLDQMPLPAICHWEGNHWVVLTDVTAKHVRVADPARGWRKLPREEFLAKWSGYAALFDYTTAFEQAPVSAPSLAWLGPFLKEHRATLTQALGLAGLVSVLGLLFPVFTQLVVDKVIVERAPGLLPLVLAGMTAALVFLLAANLLQQYLLSHTAVRLDTAVLDFLTRRLLALPMGYFRSRRTGDIQRRLDGARQLRQFLVQHGVDGLLALVQLAGCLCLMALYSARLTGVFLLTLPLYAGLMLFSRRVLRPLFSDLEEAHGRYASHQIDAIKGIEAVKAAGAELAFRDAMLAQFLKVSRQQFRGNFTMMAYQSVLQAIGFAATVLFLWAGADLVVAGRLSVGAFVAFSSLMALAGGAILRALGAWDDLQFMTVLLNRLNDIFEHEPEQGRDRSRLAPVKSLEGHLELRGVGFKFGGPESPDILRGISLEIPAGKTYALVGRSGCGKTTLVKLVAGLLEPTAGSILFDRVDSRTLNHRDLRRHIGFVLQENHIFDDTVLQNIAFGDPEPDFDRVLWSAQMANAHEFIQRLPLGYETRIGETGLGLSGGQKQRVAIARALYHDPPILIFDEATSALDTESERAIQQNLGQLTQGRTCLVIAHRLSTIRDADRIVVLEQGGVAEVGTHDELMARRGLYFYLSSQQLGPGS